MPSKARIFSKKKAITLLVRKNEDLVFPTAKNRNARECAHTRKFRALSTWGQWHEVCSDNRMYLREALARCRDLEEEVSRIYDELASQHAEVTQLAAGWAQLAREERGHAKQLGALLAVHDALDDDGPFLVGLGHRSEDCSKEIRAVYTRVREGVGPAEAIELCVALEGTEMDCLFAELRDLSRPTLRRLTDKLYKGGSTPSNHRERIEQLRPLAATGQRTDHGAAVTDRSTSSAPNG